MKKVWIPLQLHSDYSMVKGLVQPKSYVEHAAKYAIPAVALTDTATLAGWPSFYKAAFKQGIKPIPGLDIQLAWPQVPQGRVTLLAKSSAGHRALMQGLSEAWLSAPLGLEPEQLTLPWSWVESHLRDLIVILRGNLSGAGRAWSQLPIHAHGPDPFAVLLERLSPYRSHLYLSIERHGPQPQPWEAQLLEWSARHQMPRVADQPILFLKASDAEDHDIRVAIQKNWKASDPRVREEEAHRAYFPEPQEMALRYFDLPEALENSWALAQRCNWEEEPFAYRLPQLPTLEGSDSAAALLRLKSERGLHQRLLAMRTPPFTIESYEKRLESELKMIEQMGFSSYFLVVFEFIHWAKSQEIPVGPGRGSGVGSLVAYALNITDLDPLRYHLLFERFLNPARRSLPDFDIDFCPRDRDRVIDHVMERYGRDHVAQIAAFGHLRARASVRDVGRALNYPYGFIDKIVRLIPFELNMTLQDALKSSPLLRELFEEDEEVRKVLTHALALEGIHRNCGKHAGGVVISPEPLTHYTPLIRDAEGHRIMTQLDKRDLEDLGLVKFDFLGLTTLTILKDTVTAWKNHELAEGRPFDFQWDQIPLDDEKSFALLKSGETAAIFQLETRGARDLILKLQPDSFEEIIALVALNRPGPLQSGMVENFIQRKHGMEPLAYPDHQYQHPSLQPILQETYGIILYQEQVIQIAQAMAGYTLFEADLFRRAMGKKDEAVMAEQRERFASGAAAKGIQKNLALKIFELVDKFAGYGFNKSHSAAYALVSYQTLYLKSHHPDFYMAAVLTAESGNLEKLPPLLEATRRLSVKILPPDVNQSEGGFKVVRRGEIAYGLEAIRGVGAKVAEEIVKARSLGGPFHNLTDFCQRLSLSVVPKNAIEKLIVAGAFDCCEPSRAKAWAKLPEVLKAAEAAARRLHSGQQALFGESTDDLASYTLSPLVSKAFWNEMTEITQAYRVLGHFLSHHPLDILRQELKLLGVSTQIPQQQGDREGGRFHEKDRGGAWMAASLERIKLARNRADESFCILFLSHPSGPLEAIWPERLTAEVRDTLEPGEIIVMQGQIRKQNLQDATRISLKQFSTLKALRGQRAQRVVLLGDVLALQNKDPLFLRALTEWMQGMGVEFSPSYTLEMACEDPMGLARWSLQPKADSGFSGMLLPSLPLIEASSLYPTLKGMRIIYPQGSVTYLQSPDLNLRSEEAHHVQP